MKLKEIKPGMVIHCPTEEEAKELLKYLDGLGYRWFSTSEKLLESINYDAYGENMCYSIEQHMEVMYSDINYFESEGYEVTEFSDLIEPELTIEEVLSILAEIGNLCTTNEIMCSNCPLYVKNTGTGKNLCDIEEFTSNERKIIEICQQWKSDHEKKEPEVEWVYRVFGAENFGEKFFDTEEEAIKRCEELAKSQKTKKYTRYERVCRVKAV